MQILSKNVLIYNTIWGILLLAVDIFTVIYCIYLTFDSGDAMHCLYQ